MVDTITSIPAFTTYYDIIETFVTGYWNFNKIDLGPLYKTYSFNAIEGHRLRIGGRTSYKFNTKYQIEGYLAEGSLDKKLKYGFGGKYIFNQYLLKSVLFSYKNDIEQLGLGKYALSEDNILSSILRRRPNERLSMCEEYSLTYQHEWLAGLSNYLILNHRVLFPVPEQMPYFILKNGSVEKELNNITSFDATLRTRIAYNEKFIVGKLNRTSLGTRFPIIDIYYTHGFNDFLGSNFEYDKVLLQIYDRFNMSSLGYSRFILSFGKIWGTLPYPLLELHAGNETNTINNYAFNMMNYYEFVSDQYISLFYSHYFDGFFLNKIPLFKKLKWREVVWGNSVIGTLKDSNKEIMDFLPNMYSFDNPEKLNKLKPYVETGVAVENIFRFVRVDAVWRLSYLEHPDISKFGVRVCLQFKF